MDSWWKCNQCTLENNYSNLTCEACGDNRPSTDDTRTYGASKHVKPDWSCALCAFLNKGDDDICGVCNNPKLTRESAPLQENTYQGPMQRPHNSNYSSTEELRIVIIGKTGTGKSATGNSILGIPEFESKVCGASVTSKCKLGTNKRFNRKVVIVDTPGLYDTGMTNEQVTTEIVKCIGMTAPGPHAFLLTVNLASRFTEEETNTVKQFVDHFGNGMYNYLMVVFTRADELENDGISIHEYVRNAPPTLKAILHLCNNRYITLNNRLSGYGQEQQVQDLISKIDSHVQMNGGCCYTNEMWEEAEKTLRRREEEIKEKLVEEERRKVETIRRSFQTEVDKKVAALSQENERLTQQIREHELEKQRDESLSQDMRKQISDLQDQLQNCKIQEEQNDREREKKIETQLREMERRKLEQIQKQDAKYNEKRIAQMQNQIDQNERRRQKEVEDMKRENEKRMKKLEDHYKRQRVSSELRDKARKECEKEKGIFSKIVDALGGFVGGVLLPVATKAVGCVIS